MSAAILNGWFAFGFKSAVFLSAGNCAYDEQRLFSLCYGFWQRLIWRLERPVFFAREETQKCAALAGFIIANRSAEHGVAGFECVEYRPNRYGCGCFEFDVARDSCKSTQMIRERDAHLRQICVPSFRQAYLRLP